MKDVCILSLAAALLGACAHAETPRTAGLEPAAMAAEVAEDGEATSAASDGPTGLATLDADDDWTGRSASDADLDAETLAALPPAPWSESPVDALHAPEALLRSWAFAENRGWCAPLASLSADGHPRAVELDGGFGVVIDVAGQPGVDDEGEVCDDCGTGTFGVAGTMMTPCDGSAASAMACDSEAEPMIFSPSRSHCTTAPAMKIEPSSA